MRDATAPILECEGICVTYDGVRRALDEVQLRVRRGEVLALLGPNGAGKSSALRVLSTLQRPDRGIVRFDGGPAWPRRHEVRPRIGFLGDGTSMYPKMPAAVYLQFFGECYGMSTAEARARARVLLEEFELDGKATTPIARLSKGMRQRLAIARTMVQVPDVLLLDEPADGLDPHGRRALRRMLRALADGGTAIIVSSHILRELDDLCDTVAVLERGRVMVQGTVEEIVARYEVNRRVYEIEVRAGMAVARDRLASLGFLVEETRPLEGGGEGSLEGAPEDGGRIFARVRGEAEDAASLLRTLIESGVEVSRFGKVRTDLEDVYESLGRDDVS